MTHTMIFIFRNPAVFVRLAFVTPMILLTACKPPEKSEDTASDPAPEASPKTTTAPVVASTPALHEADLKRLAEPCALIALPDGSHRQGIVIQGGAAQSGNFEYLVIADIPDDVKTIHFACGKSEQPTILTARRQAGFPNGLSLFGTSTSERLATRTTSSVSTGVSFHAFRLKPGESLAPSEVDDIRAEIEKHNNTLQQFQRDRHNSFRTGSHHQRVDLSRDRDELAMIANLNARLKFPLKSIGVEETAAAPTIGDLDGSGAKLDHTLLVSSDFKVLAIRHQGEWSDIDEIISSAPSRPDHVKLAVSGSDTSVNLECGLVWKLPPAEAGFSLVAATTFELESMGGGSLEERLARVAPVPFPEAGINRSLRTTHTWGGLPTTLWVRIIENGKPDQPLIDESISLDMSGYFTARWAKPPSALVALPEPVADVPEDLGKNRSVIELAGNVLDLVAAGDGSVLMVRSDKPPFWSELDLKTGDLSQPSWTATADTLVATQADRIYLVDRKTKTLEVRDRSTGKRDAVRLLPVTGDVVAITSPREAADQPVLVFTTTEAIFVSPTDFKRVDCGKDFSPIFASDSGSSGGLTSLDPASIRLRATADGSLYSISGFRVGSPENRLVSINLRMRSNVVLDANPANEAHIPTRGRWASRDFADHGGSDISVTVSRRSGAFPASQGAIEFSTREGREKLGVLNSAPILPSAVRSIAGSPLAYDRGLYLDSALGVLLLPDGNRIHRIQLDLPSAPTRAQDFIFPGESLEFPLPAGTGHRATSDVGGEIVIAGDILKWTTPVRMNRSHSVLNLEWIGELGSPMTRSFKFANTASVFTPVAVSADGTRVLPLTRRTIIKSASSPASVAGAGQVMLTSDGAKHTAWSLTTGERLCTIDAAAMHFFGDADQLYSFSHNGTLKSYEIATGREIASADFPTNQQGGLRFQSISTGSASRGPLIAIVTEGHKNHIAQINRSTLVLKLVDFGDQSGVNITATRLYTNASGSASWSFVSLIHREGDRVTLLRPEGCAGDGIPDATGRYIVSDHHVADTGSTPPRKIPKENIPGAGGSSKIRLDMSGRYLLVTETDQETGLIQVSIRKMDAGFTELFKVRCEARIHDGNLRIISGSNSLVTALSSNSSLLGVFDLDIPAIHAELAKAPSPN